MSSVYNNLGVRFLYPENWQITDEQADEWPHSVSVQSPSGAFWSLHIYPLPVNMPALLQESLQAMQAEYKQLEHEEATEQFGEVQAEGHDLHFYCLDFVIVAKSRGILLDERAYLLWCQAESSDFDKLEMVFQAITLSLLDEGRTFRD